MQAIDEIVPTLLHALEDEQTSDTALDGLKQILRFVFKFSVVASLINFGGCCTKLPLLVIVSGLLLCYHISSLGLFNFHYRTYKRLQIVLDLSFR